jgi:hypothetical protein
LLARHFQLYWCRQFDNWTANIMRIFRPRPNAVGGGPDVSISPPAFSPTPPGILNLLAIVGIIGLGVIATVAQTVCEPAAAFHDMRLEAQSLPDKCTDDLSEKASDCAMTSGAFDIESRMFGPDLPLSKPFTGNPRSAEAAEDFWWGEAVGSYWVGGIRSCGCAAKTPQAKC